jgi:DNA end-binding protein Ku
MKNPRSGRLDSKLSSNRKIEATLQGIWSGTVSFSLVAIPVRLVKAVEPGRVSFRMLHSRDYSPLVRRMFCPEEEKLVQPDEIIRGYELGAGKYILITDEELESVSPERSRTIEIIEFIDMKDVDPVYYDHPYYLVPLKGGEKSYRLLVEVMHRTNRAGLAKFILGEREYLVAVKSTGSALSLVTLHYSEEILPHDDMAPEEGKIEPEEIDRMKRLIKERITGFNPDKFADERRGKILGILRKKAKQIAPVEAPELEEDGGEGPVDLIAVLEKSMRKVKKNR